MDVNLIALVCRRHEIRKNIKNKANHLTIRKKITLFCANSMLLPLIIAFPKVNPNVDINVRKLPGHHVNSGMYVRKLPRHHVDSGMYVRKLNNATFKFQGNIKKLNNATFKLKGDIKNLNNANPKLRIDPCKAPDYGLEGVYSINCIIFIIMLLMCCLNVYIFNRY